MQENLNRISEKIAEIVRAEEQFLSNLPESSLTTIRNKQNRTIKELLGHLVDSASNNHQRIVRLQYCDMLVFPDYTRDNDMWILFQDYQQEEWQNIVRLWSSFNLHLSHIISKLNPLALNNYWIDIEKNHITLNDIIEGYLWHLRLHLDEIHELAGD